VAVVLLDSVAVVAFLDATNVLHPAADEAVTAAAREDRLIVSAVNYAELLSGAKLGHHDEEVVRGSSRSWCPRSSPLEATSQSGPPSCAAP
jgi:hypothetical protein